MHLSERLKPVKILYLLKVAEVKNPINFLKDGKLNWIVNEMDDGLRRL